MIREGHGLTRGEILDRMGLKGNKAGEMSVSNALARKLISPTNHRALISAGVNLPDSAEQQKPNRRCRSKLGMEPG